MRTHSNSRMMSLSVVLAAALLALPLALTANAEETPAPLSLAQAQTPASAEPAPAAPAETVVTRTEVETTEVEEEPSIPISLGVSYYLLSDYVWRGINLSEFAGEGREKPNHQLTTSLTWDTGTFGRFGFDTFFEWYAAQKQLNPTTGQNIQEIDYVFRWSYMVEPIATDITLGFTFYEFPNLSKLLNSDDSHGNNNDNRTQEWWFKLAHNDAWMWKWLFPDNEDGVLNPSFFFAQDVGIGAGHTWMELGMSHTFEVVENLTITPGYLVAIDGGVLRRYRGLGDADTMRIAYDQLSLNVTYDLTPILHLPKWAGSVSISGLLYFNNAWDGAEDDGTIQDEFYGGMSVNWAWGG